MDEAQGEVTIDAKRLEELERLATLGRATAGFAHELKNGLMVVHGFAFLARKAAVGEVPDPRLSTHVAEVESHAAKLVGELRSFLALARGANEEEPRRPLAEVVREVAQLARPVAEQHARQVTVAIQDATARPVADPAFRSGLLNVALNAVDFARARVHITLARAGGGHLVTVDDDGDGVTAEARRHLFEPFASERRGGTGLGLAQAKAAVEAEGGTLACDAAPGGGARFSLFVPDDR